MITNKYESVSYENFARALSVVKDGPNFHFVELPGKRGAYIGHWCYGCGSFR